MQISEFIETTNILEQYYKKELTNEQRQIMYEELKDFSAERYRKLISKCLKKCTYFPKIADIFSANDELIGQVEKETREIFACSKCDGTGYVYYTKFKTNGDVRLPYIFAARCNCENSKYVNQKIPTYEELGIKVSNRINQIKDTTRGIEKIKEDLIKGLNF